jgi:hypothetical protein
MRLDFILYRGCVGTDCAKSGLSCNAAGACMPLTADGEPGAPDFALADLAAGDAANGDGPMPPSVDLAGADLSRASDLASPSLCGALQLNGGSATSVPSSKFDPAGAFTVEAWVDLST